MCIRDSLNIGPDADAGDNPLVSVGNYTRRGSFISYGPTESAGSAGAFSVKTRNASNDLTTAVQIWQDGRATFAGNFRCESAAAACHLDPSGMITSRVKVSSDVCFSAGVTGSGESWRVNGAGTASFRNAILSLEPDNDANYVSTTVDGEETLVYNGPTLDVKERLTSMRETFQELQVAVQNATDFGALKAAMLVALELSLIHI